MSLTDSKQVKTSSKTYNDTAVRQEGKSRKSISSSNNRLGEDSGLTDSKIYRYAEEVVSGKTVASKKNIKACQRFLDDLEKSRDPKYRWRFDLQKANRPIEFIEKFMRPSKGDYDRMELLPWQHFIEGNIYGWVDKKTGMRRFKEALIVVGRGNGKSTLISGNAIYGSSKDGENGADIFLLANSKEQSAIVYNECTTNIRNSEILKKHFRALRDGIYFDRTNSKIQHRASDSKKLDGLNTHLGVFDEIHEFKDFKLINVIKRSMNKRRQPLIIYITTLGSQLDGPLVYLYELADDILNGLIDEKVADRMFCYVAEIDKEDEVGNTESWIKANPSLGYLLDLETLKTDWERAKLIPEERADFINKQLNVFTNTGKMPFLDYEVIERNNRVIELDSLKGMDCYGGFDLSSSEDFTAANLEFPIADGCFFELSHSWTTRKKMRLNQEKLDWEGLQKEGVLTVIDGEYVKKEYVYEWFLKQSLLYNIRCIGYDPANAPFLVQMLEQEGFFCDVVRQGPLTLNAPLKDMKELYLDGKIISNRNRMLRWYTNNVKLKKDEKDNWMPSKQEKYRKIDGFAAHADSHTVYMRMNPVRGEMEPDIKVYSLGG